MPLRVCNQVGAEALIPTFESDHQRAQQSLGATNFHTDQANRGRRRTCGEEVLEVSFR